MSEPVHFESREAFRNWLERNHDRENALLVKFFKTSSGRGGLSYKEAVDESLCFGWIDGVRRSLDGESYEQRFTPRRKRSIWSLVNVRRFEELKAEGRVTPAGQAAFDAKTEDRTGVYSAEQGDITLEPGEIELLRSNAAAWAYWEKAPRSYRKPATWWVVSAKKPETRERRLRQLIECSERGERVPQFVPRKA